MIYEDEDYLVINKPSGLLVHHIRKAGIIIKREPSVSDWLLLNYPEVSSVGDDPEQRPGMMHRLDKDTSGLMMIALNKESFVFLKNKFQNREVKKNYHAITWNTPKAKQGVVDMPIGIKDGTIKRTVHGGKSVKEAVTEYKILSLGEYEGRVVSMLSVFPKTGRTHQIRVHLKYLGCPILGDSIYGEKKDGISRLMLHAHSLEFVDPSEKKIYLEAEERGSMEEFITKHLSTA